MKPKFLIAVLAAATLSTGCNVSNDYVANRAGDFTDILRGKVMAGPGVGVYVNATEFLHAGYLIEDGVSVAGFGNRDAGTWTETVEAGGLILGHYTEDTSDDFDYGCYGWTYDPFGFEFATEDNPVDWAEFRIAVMLGLGLDLELRTGELVDFLLGLATVDIAGDDR